MKIIRKHNDILSNFPEYLSCENLQEIVMSKYTSFQKISVDKIILFSFVTDAVILLSPREYEIILAMNFEKETILFEALHNNGFFINKNIDEYSLMVRHRQAIFSAGSKTLKVVILPTTGCNAQCSYCIGRNNPIANMTHDIANKAIDYIVERAIEYENIKFDWYGGEPLLMQELITLICDEVHHRLPHINYSSVITSNLVCFEDETLKQAILSWHIQKINITIDGNEKEHNVRKGYLNPGFNGYKHTLNCIRKILDMQIKIFCRFNIDRNNFHQLNSVLEDVKPFFADKNFYFFISPLRGGDWHEEFYQTDEYNELFYKTGVILNEAGVHNAIDSFVPKFQNGFCLAKSEHSIVIGPDGSLYRCNLDDLVKTNATGSVFSGLEKNDNYHKFISLELDEPCKKCIYLPVCQGGCPIQKKYTSRSNCQCDKFRYKIEAISHLLAEYYL